MALAGYATKVRVRTSSGAGSDSDNCAGVDKVALNRARDELETTAFNSTDKTFILGLKGGDVPVSGNYESGDTPQGRLSTAFGDGSSVWMVALWNGSTGHAVECKVSAFNLEASPSGKVTFSATCRMTGAVAAV